MVIQIQNPFLEKFFFDSVISFVNLSYIKIICGPKCLTYLSNIALISLVSLDLELDLSEWLSNSQLFGDLLNCKVGATTFVLTAFLKYIYQVFVSICPSKISRSSFVVIDSVSKVSFSAAYIRKAILTLLKSK